MGSGEAAGTPAKAPKTSSAQEQPAAGAAATAAAGPFPSAPEWAAAAFQAYCPTPPPGYQPHPYLWGTQPMMPYGTGPYYPYMPPGPHAYGQYAGMPPPGSANDASAGDTDGKSSDGKERSPMKKSKGSLGSLGVLSKSSGEAAKSGSANGVVSQSGESGSEGSSDGSDEDGEKRNVDQMNTEGNAGQPGYGAQGGSAFVSPGGGQAGGKAAVGTNLNMGMDYWAAPPGNQSSGKGKRGAQPMVPPMPGAQMVPHSREGVPPELWLQDERELKRQRRKQSNRESARRSRLRKQAECEELASRVETLTMENMSLRQELEQALEERNKLAADNAALLEQLQKGGTRGSESTNNNNNSNSNNNNEGEVEAHHQNSSTTSTDVNMVERNGRVEGENCETVGKAAIEAASRGEAVAAAG